MRIAEVLLALVVSAAAAASACSASGDGDSTGTADTTSSSSSSSSGTGGGSPLAGLTAIVVTPAESVLVTAPGAAGKQSFTATGKFSDRPDEDISDFVGFSLTHGDLGTFAGPELTAGTSRGGVTRVLAKAGSLTGEAELTIRLEATLLGPDEGDPLPADPAKSFEGTADPSRAPALVYPNDGVMLPPNVQRLEVHYALGAPQNTLFELTFESPTASIKTFLRCPNPTAGGCIFELDPIGYAYVAGSNSGGPPAKLRVRGSDDAASGFGESEAFDIAFAAEPVEGALYYWTTSQGTGIMRFDFGADALAPDVALSPSKDGFDACVGCHALSRDGTKMVASLGGQNDGRLVYRSDLSKPDFTLKGDPDNRIQFASFDPTGQRFAAIFGDTDEPERNRLWFHDGLTGLRLPGESIDLAFEPDHPDWAPSGDLLAVSRVGEHNTSQRPYNCGIELLTRTGQTFGAPETLVPIVPGLSRYNPSFAPDSSFLLYSESTCPGGGSVHAQCDGDADPSAKTWAVEPQPGKTPLLLARASSPGVADQGATDLADTFPRFSPFQKKQGQGRIFWATISSTRKAGLRDTSGHQLLWMFAVDPDAVAQGKDGSSPGFFLPFQDLTTSNHIAQWTTQIIQPPK